MNLISVFQFGNTFIEGTSNDLNWFDHLYKLGPIIVSIAALATSIASYKLSKTLANNFDVKKLFIQEQAKTVIKFLSKFEHTNISIVYFIDEYAHNIHSLPIYAIDVSLVELNRKYDNRKLLLEDKFDNLFDFSEFQKDVLLPKPIAVELKKIRWLRIELMNDKMKNEFVGIGVNENKKNQILFDSRKFYKLNKPQFTFQNISNFLYQIVEVRRVTHEWLKEFDIPNLNTLDVDGKLYNSDLDMMNRLNVAVEVVSKK
jgi:hypothetical protein